MTARDEDIRRALAITHASPARDRTVDITTTGRRSGRPRRIEIWFYRAFGEIYLSGLPGRRSWPVNLAADPHFTFHLKHGVQADLAAIALPVTDGDERRRIFTDIVTDLNQPANPARIAQPTDVEDWIRASPLLRVTFDRFGERGARGVPSGARRE